MSQYTPHLHSDATVFNVSDYTHDEQGLSIATADQRYPRLSGYNNFSGFNNYFKTVSLHDSNFNIYNSGILTASINNYGVASVSALIIAGIDIGLLFAPIHSPKFTGIPTAPTPVNKTNSDQIATCTYVRNNINDLLGGAPWFLDTLNEIAIALNNDPDFANTVFALIINLKQNIIDCSNRLNASYVGNGDVTNTTLSYLKM